MPNCDCHTEASNKTQRKVLLLLLLINGFMFTIELGFGIFGQSTGLIADAMDMLADAAVYGIAIYAIGHGLNTKIRIAYISGVLQIILAFGVLLDVLRRLTFDSEPEPIFMVILGFVALAANIICLILIAKHRKGEIHMRASWVFSKNDVIANLGVILAGFLVTFFNSAIPDLIIGGIITIVVIRGGLSIIHDAKIESVALKGH